MSRGRSTRSSPPGEFEFLRWLAKWLDRRPPRGRVVLGAGDDCALVELRSKRIYLTTDCLVEGTHFHREWMSGAELGGRAFRVSASDLAAMGATPRVALLSLEVPRGTPQSYLRSILKGFQAACRREQTDLVGGNLAASPVLGVTVFLLGTSSNRPIQRDRGRAGDVLVVSGTLGDAAGGLALLYCRSRRKLTGRWEKTLVGRWLRPPNRSRLAQRLAKSGLARSMIDISDGLLQDLGHICRASGVGAVVETAKIPISRALRHAFGPGAVDYALRGGEDYELLFSTPAKALPAVLAIARDTGCRVTQIGELVRRKGLELAQHSGWCQSAGGNLGFDHLRRQ